MIMQKKCVILMVVLSLCAILKANPIDYNSIDGDDYGDYLIDWSQFSGDVFGEPDNATGELVARYNPGTHNMNPEELGSYYEGDIMMPRVQGRNGLPTTSSRWPNNNVPFEIKGNFQAREMQLIEDAINDFHKYTCVRFSPRRGETDYVKFVSSSTGCWSSVGRIGGGQEINLQIPGCTTSKGTVIHEMIHAVGFMHEQNRAERDSFVSIQWQNLKPNVDNNFEKIKNTQAYGVPYDYGSIMHYSANAFSKNGQPTIVATRSGGAKMGQRVGFSQSDLQKINSMYKCSSGGGGSYPSNSRPLLTGSSNSQTTVNPVVGFFANLFGSLAKGDEQQSLGTIRMGQREGFSSSDLLKINRMYHCNGQQYNNNNNNHNFNNNNNNFNNGPTNALGPWGPTGPFSPQPFGPSGSFGPQPSGPSGGFGNNGPFGPSPSGPFPFRPIGGYGTTPFFGGPFNPYYSPPPPNRPFIPSGTGGGYGFGNGAPPAPFPYYRRQGRIAFPTSK